MKNNLETNKKKNPKMWFWEMKFVLTKNEKKKDIKGKKTPKNIKHVFCKLDFCFKLKRKRKKKQE